MSALVFSANIVRATARPAPTCNARLGGRILRRALAGRPVRVESKKSAHRASSKGKIGLERRLHDYVNGGGPNIFYMGLILFFTWWFTTIQLHATPHSP
ncbi:hypothetical protein WJX73_007770 [Symbiochloris irregularis]|uniref:Uncharacterized protein n=1 Tax=Symbiochloris irregularis TaxID=706552 RepID=A0AAW1NG75_9CHLO